MEKAKRHLHGWVINSEIQSKEGEKKNMNANNIHEKRKNNQ